jgi:hypothetical protein
MTRKSRKPIRARVATPAMTSRNVLLAGLGAVSRGRRQAGAAIDAAFAEVGQLPVRGAEAAVAVRRSIDKAAAQAIARLAPVRRRAEAFARDAEREFQTVAAPVLVRLGLAEPARKTATRKTAPRKSAARKTVARKPASRRRA